MQSHIYMPERVLWSPEVVYRMHSDRYRGLLKTTQVIVSQIRRFIIYELNYLDEKQKLIDRLLYGNLPSTLQGQKTLALIGSNAVGLSPKTRENIYFRKDHAAVEIPIRVNPIYCFA